MIGKYRYVVETDPEAAWVCYPIELPGLVASGESPEVAIKVAQELVGQALTTMRKEGLDPPSPGTDRRIAQVNIRLTEREKLMVVRAAGASGVRSVSDYVRKVLLDTIAATEAPLREDV